MTYDLIDCLNVTMTLDPHVYISCLFSSPSIITSNTMIGTLREKSLIYLISSLSPPFYSINPQHSLSCYFHYLTFPPIHRHLSTSDRNRLIYLSSIIKNIIGYLKIKSWNFIDYFEEFFFFNMKVLIFHISYLILIRR